ncbi:Bacterial extracellular solute-binding proteins, family 3 [Rhodobacteraceae bacterium THAF1]|uniref:substrate-binding periplasmic protein n=1 Tax=Palleronia sp. THAF1 TaxID=2587842 RepID=UPI000F4170C1|nr:transporter substrate-binding domain-containing protein [Palleronia sp. THAF1]QFU09111.1 Bacterial extracellular solute-binding protein, family 3 [Palleronia sp. THAF1]VDC24081.1 Bacterial extracellular solute-binding proteins, family 3 [Rhodobacteraceae bacterium THAF1]
MIRALFVAMTLGLAGPATAQDPCADYVPQPKPQNVGRDIVGQDMDTIVERGWMTFALYEDFPPYSWEEGGQPRGVDVEIAALIADYVGVEPRYRFVGAGENLDADLRNNVWRGGIVGGAVSNVMMRVPYDSAYACRVEQVVFTGQYAQEVIAIAYAEAEYPEEKPVPAYFRFDTVAVENDSLSDFYLSNFAGGQLNTGIRRFATLAEGMDALAEGEVMAAMGPRAQLEWGADDGIGIHQPPLAGLARGQWTLGVGVHFAYRPLAYTVDDALREALTSGRIEEIYASYGLTHTAPEYR